MVKWIGTRAPWMAALLLALCTQTLFGWNVAQVDHLVFDETHYVPAARHIVRLDEPANIEHPMVGKVIIAAGIMAIGDNPLGWRLLGTLAGTMTILGVFTLTLVLFESVTTAATASLLAMLNGLLYVQARIAMPDIFLCAFIIWGLALAAMALTRAQPVAYASGAGLMLGLATGTKWMAAPFVAAVCIGYLYVQRRDRQREALQRRRELAQVDVLWASTRGIDAWKLALVTGSVAVLTYFASFWPAFFYSDHPIGGLGDLLRQQIDMYRLQTQVLPSHPYQSSWGTWPLLTRPIWYLFEAHQGGQRCILMLANPATAAMGLVATTVCIVRWWHGDHARQGMAAALWVFAWVIFAAIPKSLGFVYYFVPASSLLAVATAGAMHCPGSRARGAMVFAVLLAASGFALFKPIYSGERLATGAYNKLMWLDSWR